MKRSYEYLEMNINKVAIFEDVHCEKHLEGLDILPERSARTKAISEALHTVPFVEFLTFHSSTPVSNEDLMSIHDIKHIDNVDAHIQIATDIGRSYMVDRNSDVLVTEGSDIAAAHAAGAMRDAVKVVYGGLINKVFCNVRPPGHHAHRHKAEGFCLYNNVWFGANEVRKLYEMQGLPPPRIAIIDWDLHHGDGTQHFVLANTELFTYFVSIHQTYNSTWPMTGKEWRKEHGNSVSINHNIKPRHGDKQVKEYFEDTLIPELREWKPDIIFISCGFDAHALDSIGRLEYSSELYGWMTSQLVSVANDLCRGRIISVLEGGYNLQALRESSVEHVAALVGI